MILLYVFLLIGVVTASHYRGGTISYSIRDNVTAQGISIRLTQRHSWRRSAYFCNNTDPNSGNVLGEGALTTTSNTGSSLVLQAISALVRCTDYNAEFDYSTGEYSTTLILPVNKQIEYYYQGCCWIPLLPPDSASNWSLRFLVNTKRRLDGTMNNSPKTTMNPIVQVEIGKVHTIRIPMADSDGDPLKCRWGKTVNECGSICAPKGPLRSNPCELTYNATKLGYHAVAVVIEDFDSNNNVISAIPLQFIIHIVNATSTTTPNCTDPSCREPNCTEPPVYVGEWPEDSCIGIASNTTINARIQMRIPCQNTSVTLKSILTVSPGGLIRGEIVRELSDRNLYTMPIQWTPQTDQYGVHQLCVTPVDSRQRTGSQVCLTFQVDVGPPEFILVSPMGLVPATQSSWTIVVDRNIAKPRRSNGVYIRFFQRATNQEVYRIDVTTDTHIIYQSRQIKFFTTGHTWQQGQEYYILLDSGIAIINESCGVESVSLTNPNIWIFQVAAETTFMNEIQTTKQLVLATTEQIAPVVTEKIVQATTEEVAPVVTEKAVQATTEQIAPVVTEKVVQATTEQIAPVVTEKVVQATTEQIAPVVTEKVVQATTEQIAPVVTEKVVQATTEQVAPVVTEKVVQATTEQIAPVVTEKIVQATTEEVAPVVTEKVIQATTEQIAPVVTEKVVQATTEKIAPVVTEKIVQATTEQIAPVVTEKVIQATTEEVAPVVTEKVIQATTEQIAPVVTEKIVQATTEQIAPVVTEKVIQATTEQIAPVVTEKIVQATTEQIAPVVTEEIIQATTEQIAPVVTEKVIQATTEQIAPVVTEKIVQATTEQIAPVVTEKVVQATTEQIAVATTRQIFAATTEQAISTRQTTAPVQSICPRWFQFDRISNESTSAEEPIFIFCFRVETALADVTISANTWVPCMTWKISGTADPLLELYAESNGTFLAQNDDGNSHTHLNCYAAVLSYRLQRGDYRVVIRNPKCAYGKFEIRLLGEFERNLK